MTRKPRKETEAYKKAALKAATYSNGFNFSFGKLTEIENKFFDFLVSQIDIKNLKEGYNNFAVRKSALIQMLNRGKRIRGDSKDELLYILDKLQSLTFFVPDYKNDRIIIDHYFNKICIDMSGECIEFGFTDTAQPYILQYRDSGFGFFAIPFDLLDRIKSKKAYLILKAVSGRLYGQQNGILQMTPKNWDVVFNGRNRKSVESPSEIVRDIKRGTSYLNKHLQDCFKMDYSVSRKGKNVSSISVTVTVLSGAIKSTPVLPDNRALNLDNVDLCQTKNVLDKTKKSNVHLKKVKGISNKGNSSKNNTFMPDCL